MQESLSDIEVFLAVADSGHVAHAARALGLTPAGASAALKRLEAVLGTRLVLRTTRRLRLSEAGERYLPLARQALSALRSARAAIADDASALTGLLRITAPADFGRNRLTDRLLAFAQRHPGVRFQISFDDAVVDFYSNPVDLALRYGALGDARLVALPLALLPRVLCASPDYIARRGEPAQPEDLARHDVLCFMQQQRAFDRWRLRREGELREVEVAPRWTFADAEMVRRFALRGLGIAFRILGDIEDDLAQGRLLRVLPEWSGEPVPLSLVTPDRPHAPALRALIEFLRTGVT